MSDDESDHGAPSDRSAGPDEEDVPLSDLARRVSERRRRRGERASDAGPGHPSSTEDSSAGEEPSTDRDPGDDPFDQMSVGDIDEEALWSSLAAEDDPASAVGIGDAAGGTDPETVTDSTPDAREHVVAKSAYCQKCPYLDDPPELACTHEGTEIVEVVDTEHFRVRNCPMIEE